jgi:hypothetical protein
VPQPIHRTAAPALQIGEAVETTAPDGTKYPSTMSVGDGGAIVVHASMPPGPVVTRHTLEDGGKTLRAVIQLTKKDGSQLVIARVFNAQQRV